MRYIDADKLCEALKSMASVQYPDKQNTILGVVSSIENFPTADVVPKSEVEKLKNELVIWKQDRFNLYQRLELYEITRQKVAREIFEEIEKCLRQRFSDEVEGEYRITEEDFAELKKKYTEDNK